MNFVAVRDCDTTNNGELCEGRTFTTGAEIAWSKSSRRGSNPKVDVDMTLHLVGSRFATRSRDGPRPDEGHSMMGAMTGARAAVKTIFRRFMLDFPSTGADG